VSKRLVRKIAEVLPHAAEVRVDIDSSWQRWYVIVEVPTRRPGVAVFGSFASQADAEAALAKAQEMAA